jgi:hypothetical protein
MGGYTGLPIPPDLYVWVIDFTTTTTIKGDTTP